MYDAPSIYLLGYLASKGLVFINMAYVQKLKAFQHFICHTLRHRSCITISQRGFAECAERLVCMDAYADTHIQNHAWTQLHADTNAFQCVLFTQIQIHNNSCQKKMFSDLESLEFVASPHLRCQLCDATRQTRTRRALAIMWAFEPAKCHNITAVYSLFSGIVAQNLV